VVWVVGPGAGPQPPNPQSPIPNPQSPCFNNKFHFLKYKILFLMEKYRQFEDVTNGINPFTNTYKKVKKGM
jgi:hypothetical protein